MVSIDQSAGAAPGSAPGARRAPREGPAATARPRRRRPLALALAGTLAALPIGLAAPAASAGAANPITAGLHAAVVTGPGGTVAAAAAVRAAGGSVREKLPLVSGVVADLPAGARLPGFTVAADRPLSAAAASGLETAATASDPVSTARATLGLDASSPSGAGVTVAVVDTGIADVPDLAGRVQHLDVSFDQPGSRRAAENGASAENAGDGYGHGTFVAGLVAGDGRSSGGRYAGAAPGARLLDVRVAEGDGRTSLVSVLRGLQAVASHARALHIRVLNLSLDSGSPLPYQLDPLTQALEALWRQGITVVTASGNDGPTPGSVSSPGLDPMLLTAGALDENGTADRADDTVADYSSRGPAAQGVAKPDLVAPGSHLVSLRAPGSVVDDQNPGSRVADGYFRGSGTSMSTALVSGAAADLLAARPALIPDQVKALLTGTADRTAGLTDRAAAGAGEVDVAAALAAPAPDLSGADDPTVAPEPTSLSPAEQRRWDRFADAMLAGRRAEAYAAWRSLSPGVRSDAMNSWTTLSPDARSWIARSWIDRSWVGADGTADDWIARSWIARSWIARSWIARSWIARSWIDQSWVARSWIARSWIDDDWAARSWIARSWIARSWIAQSWTSTGWD